MEVQAKDTKPIPQTYSVLAHLFNGKYKTGLDIIILYGYN